MDRADSELEKLIFVANDYGIENVKTLKGPFTPFIISETNKGDRQMDRIMSPNLETSVKIAKEKAEKMDVKLYAITYDGYTTIEGVKYDAVFTIGCCKTDGKKYYYAQRYKLEPSFEVIGNIAIVEIEI